MRRFKKLLGLLVPALAILALVAFASSPVYAQFIGSGDWTNTGSSALGYTAGTVSGSSGSATVTSGATTGAGTWPIELGYASGGTGTLTVSGAAGTLLNGVTNLFVGYNGTGSLNIATAGSVTDAIGYIGYTTGAAGTATVDGPGSTWTNTTNLYVGGGSSTGGTGTLNITNGGIVTTSGQLRMANNNTGCNGAVYVSGGSQLTATGVIYTSIGTGSVGSLSITNGTVSSANSVVLSYAGTSTTTVDGSNSKLSTGSTLYIGGQNGAIGFGTLTITNGGLATASAGCNTGNGAGATATFNVNGTGSELTLNGNFSIDVSPTSTATINITNGGYMSNTGTTGMGWAGGTTTMYITNGGTVNNTGALGIGYASGSVGTVTVDGAGSAAGSTQFSMPSNTLYVGQSGIGKLFVYNGGSVTDVTGYVGNAATAATSAATVNGANSTWTNTGVLYVGYSGGGSLMIANGGAVSNTTGYVGVGAAVGGTVTVDGTGSTWTSTAALYVGNSGLGTLNVSNGGVVAMTNAGSGFYIGSAATSSGTVNQTGGTVTSASGISVGFSGSGTYNISGGALTPFNNMSIAGGYLAAQTGVGVVNVSGSAYIADPVNGTIWVGETGVGQLNMSGGTINIPNAAIELGHMYDGSTNSVASGTVTQSGGIATNLWTIVGHGEYDLSGGTLNTTWTTWLGAATATSAKIGTLNVSGTGVLLTGSIEFGVPAGGWQNGSGGTGTLYLSDSGYIGPYAGSYPGVYLGRNPTAYGYFYQTGGTLAQSALRIGEYGIGVYNLSNGLVTLPADGNNGDVNIGDQNGSQGTLTMTGGTINANALKVGNNGYGILNQSDGLVTTTGDCEISNNFGSAGSVYTMTGGTLSVGGGGDFYISYDHDTNGLFIQNGGVVTTTNSIYGTMYIGEDPNQHSANYHLINGSVTALALVVGDQGSGIFTQDGGTVTVSATYTGGGTWVGDGFPIGTMAIGGDTSGVGVYNLNGGVLNADPTNGIVIGYLGSGTLSMTGGVANLSGGPISGNGTAVFNFSGGILKNVGLVSVPITLPGTGTGPIFQEDGAFSGTVTGNINGTGGLTKTGKGTLYFTGANTYGVGSTVVIQGGTLDLAKTAQDTTSLADIQAGKLIFDYTNPGDDPSSQIAAVLKASHDSGWSLTPGIGSTTADATHGLGWLDDTGNVKVDIMYTLYGDANLDGSVNGADLNVVLSNYNQTGMTWSQGDFNYDGTVNGADLNTVLSNYNQSLSVGAAVPEPSTLLLAGAGLAALLAYGWRKRR